MDSGIPWTYLREDTSIGELYKHDRGAWGFIDQVGYYDDGDVLMMIMMMIMMMINVIVNSIIFTVSPSN
jgi:hypothetical protein